MSYVTLSKLEPLVEAGKKFESALHKNDREKKSATWLLKAAKDADIALDENMKLQIQETLGQTDVVGRKRKRRSSEDDGDDQMAPIDIMDESEPSRRKQKEVSKVQQLKNRYEDLKKQENFKKFSNSSFLTPEAASYLNEIIKNGSSKADMEIVFAG